MEATKLLRVISAEAINSKAQQVFSICVFFLFQLVKQDVASYEESEPIVKQFNDVIIIH